jgi:hypothetical protein
VIGSSRTCYPNPATFGFRLNDATLSKKAELFDPNSLEGDGSDDEVDPEGSGPWNSRNKLSLVFIHLESLCDSIMSDEIPEFSRTCMISAARFEDKGRNDFPFLAVLLSTWPDDRLLPSKTTLEILEDTLTKEGFRELLTGIRPVS